MPHMRFSICHKFCAITALLLLAGCRSSSLAAPTATLPDPAAANTAAAVLEISSDPAETILPPSSEALPAELAAPSSTPVLGQVPVKAIILFIGDGMGANHRLAAQWLAYGQEGALAMDKMPVSGWLQTAAADSPVTDSGAAATAMSAGVKTNRAAVGVDVNGQPVDTILEQAQMISWSVGLVTTTDLADATPAAFIAHVPDRARALTIAQQMAGSGIDVLLGGGEDDFLLVDNAGCFEGLGHRTDGRHLLQEMIDMGYTSICSPQEFAALDLAQTNKLLGFFGGGGIARPYRPTLAEMTQAAISILSHNPYGFFLMVEAGQIDWTGHYWQSEDMMKLTLGLDQAVAVAQAYALQQPNTLLIVTADHETGGLQVSTEQKEGGVRHGPYRMPDGTPFWLQWSTSSHTGQDVPLTAQGPFSQLLAGSHPNTWVYEVMRNALLGIWQ